MNGKINADLQSINFIFNRNKPYILPGVIILACFILIFQFIIPQFNEFIKTKQEAKEASLKLDVLKGNLNVLINTNENSLDSQLKVLILALPPDKDFDGILNSINNASNKAGISLGAFSLQIGSLSNSEKNGESQVLSVSLPINAGIAEVYNFLEIINNSVPLSEISSVKSTDKTSTVSLSFYYKPLASSISENVPIKSLSSQGFSLVNKLSGFANVTSSGN